MFFEKQHQRPLKVNVFKSLSNQPPKGLSFFQKGLSLFIQKEGGSKIGRKEDGNKQQATSRARHEEEKGRKQTNINH
jgi:hypothetical protein